MCVPTTESLSERDGRAKRYFVAATPKGMREALFPANLFSHWSLVIGHWSVAEDTKLKQLEGERLKMIKISVILPVYNEAECIDNTFDSVLAYSKLNPSYHFIFVNDGSTDETQLILEKRIKQSQTRQLMLVSYNTNQGKGYAVKKGLEYGNGDYICFIDSDLAYSLAHLELIVDKLELFDVVIGCRNLIPDSVKRVKFTRKLAGQVFNIISRKILSLKYNDMQAGVKGFRKCVAKDLFEKQTLTGFAFDVELIYLAKKNGYTIGEIPAIVSDIHLHKKSKVDLLKDSIEMFFSLINIKYNDTIGRYG